MLSQDASTRSPHPHTPKFDQFHLQLQYLSNHALILPCILFQKGKKNSSCFSSNNYRYQICLTRSFILFFSIVLFLFVLGRLKTPQTGKIASPAMFNGNHYPTTIPTRKYYVDHLYKSSTGYIKFLATFICIFHRKSTHIKNKGYIHIKMHIYKC